MVYLLIDVRDAGLNFDKITPDMLASLGPLVDAKLEESFSQKNTQAVASLILAAREGGSKRLLVSWQGCELTDASKVEMVKWILQQLHAGLQFKSATTMDWKF